ncbi:TetR/AcrR family transcriptional regulator [Marisediminicola sp. LYQ134]|uniref:TetR/AcrR family transcriptional regulator n=1 Tax=Marisediminicola sp. LYQ134 TaxID=3391061 RepID=UPI0039834C7A
MSTAARSETPSSVPLLRNAPVQARSNARLTSLLDAAAAVIAESGYERLTTAMIAERAGSSIGTVYRYFPERIAVLHALAARAMERFESDGVPAIEAGARRSWTAAVDALVEFWIDQSRVEPGFRSLRFGDVLDLRPRETEVAANAVIASRVADILRSESALESSDIEPALEVAIEICDALVARAFAFDGEGDDVFVAAARSAPRDYLLSRFPAA